MELSKKNKIYLDLCHALHSSDKLLRVQTSKRAKKVIDENFISEELKTIIGERVLQCYGKWTLWYKAASKVCVILVESQTLLL